MGVLPGVPPGVPPGVIPGVLPGVSNGPSPGGSPWGPPGDPLGQSWLGSATIQGRFLVILGRLLVDPGCVFDPKLSRTWYTRNAESSWPQTGRHRQANYMNVASEGPKKTKTHGWYARNVLCFRFFSNLYLPGVFSLILVPPGIVDF